MLAYVYVEGNVPELPERAVQGHLRRVTKPFSRVFQKQVESSVSVLKWIAAHATEHAVKISSYTAHVSHE